MLLKLFIKPSHIAEFFNTVSTITTTVKAVKGDSIMPHKTKNNKEAALVICSAAGQGLQTAEDFISKLFSETGFYVFTTREYMSRVRGGNNSSLIRVSASPVRAITDRIDYLFALAPGIRKNILRSISEDTIIFVGDSDIGHEFSEFQNSIIDLNLKEVSSSVGGPIFAATIVVGLIAELFSLADSIAYKLIDKKFSDKILAEKNRLAFVTGRRLGVKYNGHSSALHSNNEKSSKKEIKLMSGNSAVSLGAAAAGCNFVSAYPMSPGTGVFTFFVNNADKFNCVTEQAEDEIAAINMAIGASFSGARAMTTTSGGGFALMSEGISLAGMTETPVVIHLAQRPGPATGLATRTEQGDLELALYAGHGDFPRLILAPGSVESAFRIGQKAFHLANEYRIPVIILTDQYLLESSYDVNTSDFTIGETVRTPLKSKEGYKHYNLSGNVTDPFAVPGYGKGIVFADSHEHTEEGHITEDMDIRAAMTDRRALILEKLRDVAELPEIMGSGDKIAVVCWGSTIEAMREVASKGKFKNVTFILCEQIYPLNRDFGKLLSKFEKIIFVEGNGTGEFARLVKAETGIKATDMILKYNGFQYSVEELESKLSHAINKETLI